MTGKSWIALLAVLLFLAAALTVFLVARSTGVEEADAAELVEAARQSQQAIEDRLSQGEVLFVEYDAYTFGASDNPNNAFNPRPDQITLQLWISTNAEGTITELVTHESNTETGELFSIWSYDGEKHLIENLRTGEVESLPVVPGTSIKPWLESFFGRINNLATDGFSDRGSTLLNGAAVRVLEKSESIRPSAVFDTVTSNSVSQESRATVEALPDLRLRRRVEINEENPLLIRSSQWEEDDQGNEILKHRTEYRRIELLPAGTRPSR